MKKNRQHNGQKKIQRYKQRSTKHTHKTKDRVTRTPLRIGDEHRCEGRANSSCSTRINKRYKPCTDVHPLKNTNTIKKMNDNINMDSTIVASINARS